MWAVVLAVAFVESPFYVRGAIASLESIDETLVEAARTLGAPPFQVFRRVALPLAAGGLAAASALALARGLGEFGATLLFAGSAPGRRTLAVEIYLLNEQPGDAAEQRMWRLVAASVVLACAALGASEYLERRGARRESA